MLLNLGCGRMIFPTKPDDPMIQHVKYALIPNCPDALDPSAQWCNVDQTPGPGVNEVFDLFAYPWLRSSNASPFNDNSVDTIWCSHIIEHIPHVARLNFGISIYPEVERAAKNDGWWGFFQECHRVLKPGGLMHVLAPMGMSTAGMSDPTHMRYLSPASFSYFVPNPNAPFDYRDAPHFEATGVATMRLLGEAAKMSGILNSADSALAAAEPGSDSHKEIEAAIVDVTAELQSWIDTRFNAADEFFLTLRAVKEPQL